MITYLYIKEHNVTGLKYFGKTTRQDYENYTGSGKYWLRHIKKHGKDITTKLYYSSDSLEKIQEAALKFSLSNNIVESNEWANLKYENGKDGGSQSEWITKDTRIKMSENRRGKVGIPSGWKHSEDTKAIMSEKARDRCKRLGAPKGAFKKGNVPKNKGVPMSEEQKELLREKAKNRKKKTCLHCGKSMTAGNYSRWHGDNCKEKL